MSSVSESTPLLAASPKKPPAHFRSIMRSVLSSVTVEPALMLQSLAHSVDEALLQKLMVDKLCSVHFQFDTETCRNLASGNHTTEQDEVQRLASTYNTYNHLAEYLPALLSSLFLGSLGDSRGRRLPVIISFIGYLLTGMCFLANVYWWWLPTQLLYVSMLPLGLCGGNIGIPATINAYLSSKTGDRSRTFSLSTVECIKYFSYPLGMFLVSVMYAHGSYLLVYCFYVLATLVAVLYLIFCVGEPPVVRSEETGQGPSPGLGMKEGVTARLRMTFSVPGMLRRSGSTGVLVVAHTTVVVLWLLTRGTKDDFFLYERKEFEWEYSQFNQWLIFDFIMKAVGLLLVMPIFSYYLLVQDAMLGFIGGVCMIFFYTILGTAPKSWVLYVASTFSLGSSIPVIASKAAISKNVAAKDYGAVFALLAVLECLVGLLGPLLYTLIYNATLDIFPGTLFAVMGGASVFICWINVWLLTDFQEHRRSITK